MPPSGGVGHGHRPAAHGAHRPGDPRDDPVPAGAERVTEAMELSRRVEIIGAATRCTIVGTARRARHRVGIRAIVSMRRRTPAALGHTISTEGRGLRRWRRSVRSGSSTTSTASRRTRLSSSESTARVTRSISPRRMRAGCVTCSPRLPSPPPAARVVGDGVGSSAGTGSGSGGAGAAPKGRASIDREQNQAIRDWARKRGMKVSDRGRIPAEVLEAYHKENSSVRGSSGGDEETRLGPDARPDGRAGFPGLVSSEGVPAPAPSVVVRVCSLPETSGAAVPRRTTCPER